MKTHDMRKSKATKEMAQCRDWTKRLRREMGERLGAVSGTEGEPGVERF